MIRPFVFFIFGLLGVLAVIAANAAPQIHSVYTSTSSQGFDELSIDLVENGTLTLFINGRVTDKNNCSEIDNPSDWTVKVYRSGVLGGKDCVPDNNNCYTASPETIVLTGCTQGGDLTLDFEAQIPLEYYADPTDIGSPYPDEEWIGYVEVVDEGIPPYTASFTDTFEVNSLLALEVTGNVNYGVIPFSGISEEQTLTFTNTGNRAIDLEITASGNMVCGFGSREIPAENVHLSGKTGFDFDYGQAVSLSPSGFDLSLAARTDESVPITKDIFARLKMLDYGVRGSCGNTLSFRAVPDF